MITKVHGLNPAAFFDLDGTLITVNSGALWMKRERRLGRISFRQMIQATFYLVAYKFSVLDMDKVMNKALQTVKDIPAETVRRWTREWFDEHIARHFAPGARPVLDFHRNENHPLILLTSSSPFESEIACMRFGLDDYISSRYETTAGVLTGRLIPPSCYGRGKVTWAEKYAAKNEIDLGNSYFYTDSFSDLPMLERVTHPMVVNPDMRLRRIGKKRQWPILDWQGPWR